MASLVKLVGYLVIAQGAVGADGRALRGAHGDAEEESGRRLASGMLLRGEGRRTPTFGGGHAAQVAAQRRLPTKALGDCIAGGQWTCSGGDPSNGQSGWAAVEIFSHTPLAREPGVFVEFGGRDGVYESNTHLFEKTFKWTGVLVEAGRDYIFGLRHQRGCQVGSTPGACVWSALSDVAGDTVYWTPFDKTLDAPVAAGDTYQKQAGYDVREEDAAVKTRLLQEILDHFEIKHVDWLSADCEGCETKALASLDFVKTTIDLINVEFPSCETLRQLAKARYVIVPLSIGYDTFFVHERIAKAIPAPRLLKLPKASVNPLPANAHNAAADLQKKLETCPDVAKNVWGSLDAWPPAL